MVEGLIATNLDRYKASGTELVMGEAKFTGSKTLDVRLNDGGVRTLTVARIFLNLGTHASIPLVPGLAEAEPLTKGQEVGTLNVPPPCKSINTRKGDLLCHSLESTLPRVRRPTTAEPSEK
jgi:pyruvate/2-oxoglutarate dehydrogenase complex dihydrolipoamide dehydrogenase (E3) component